VYVLVPEYRSFFRKVGEFNLLHLAYAAYMAYPAQFTEFFHWGCYKMRPSGAISGRMRKVSTSATQNAVLVSQGTAVAKCRYTYLPANQLGKCLF
jgi:hypothetical protein